jgi:hypothetical protein
MALAIVMILFLVALGIAAVRGWTADSRDPQYGVGALLRYAHKDPAP